MGEVERWVTGSLCEVTLEMSGNVSVGVGKVALMQERVTGDDRGGYAWQAG